MAVLTNLLADTHYTYTVSTADGALHKSGQFRTAIEANSNQPFVFTVFTDTHTAHGAAGESLAASAESRFVIIGGDLTNQGYRWNEWKNFFEKGEPYLIKNVVIPVLGGHDLENWSRPRCLKNLENPLPTIDGAQIFPAQNFRYIWGLDLLEAGTPYPDISCYSKQYGNLRYIVLDTYIDSDAMARQLQWLERVLQQNSAQWTLACFHEPAFAIGSRGNMGRQQEFVEIFERYGVDFVISGHNHIYERFLPLGSPGNKPVQYININANGGLSRVARPSPILADGMGRVLKSYLEFRVDGEKITVLAKSAEGEEFDRLELLKKDGVFQPDYMRSAISVEYARRISHIFTTRKLANRSMLPGGYLSVKTRGDTSLWFMETPQPGKPVKAKLETENFPKGSRLLFSGNGRAETWGITAKRVDIVDDQTEIELTAPEGLTFGEDGQPFPPVSFGVRFEHEGRVFSEVDLIPTVKNSPPDALTSL